jgi:hypothetical protein
MFINRGNRILRMAETGGAGGATGDGTGTGGGEKPWFDGFDAETKGYLQTKTWDKKTAAEAFLEASKAHREAEKFVGAPADKLLRIPDERATDTPEARERHVQEWQKIHQRLGKPTDAKDYDFSSVKRTGDKALEQNLSDSIRQAAWNANLSKDGAIRLAQDVVKHLDGVESASAAAAADKLATEKRELDKNWGNNAAANMVVAKAAAAALGISPEGVAALERVIGYAKVMDMFRVIGTKIGEDRFVSPPGGGGGEVMTRDQAVAEKEALKKDKAWVDRYLKGGTDEKRRMDALDRIISGVK